MDPPSELEHTGITLASIPLFIWQLYLDYLVYYEPNSWVARIAYTFRILAVLTILPIIILLLLDITSYVIARTLGVVDVSKASTSDKAGLHQGPTPSILVSSPTNDSISSADGAADSPIEHNTTGERTTRHRPSIDTAMSQPPSESPHAYFVNDEENLKLAGVGVFSPASSQPPSPTLSRRVLKMEGMTPMAGTSSESDDVGLADEGAQLSRKRAKRNGLDPTAES